MRRVSGDDRRGALHILCDALFHLRRKRRRRPGQLVVVHLEHHLLKHGKRHTAARFVRAEGMTVVEPDANRHGDALGTVRRSDEEGVLEIIGRSGLAHDGNRKRAGVQRVSGARGNADDAPETLLNQRQGAIAQLDGNARLLVCR
jgi:hypothetical protein